MLVLALAGLGVAIYLWHVHQIARAGGKAACDISATLNCTDVARSEFAQVLGVPLAAWGTLAYLTVAGLAATALGRRRERPSWPGGILVVLTGLMTLGAVALASISEFVLHMFCPFCAVSWGISLALLGLSIVLARRAGGLGAAVRADVAALKARKGPAVGAAAVLAAMAVALLGWYSNEQRAEATAKAKEIANTAVIPLGAPGSLVVYEYSDYLCPHCAVMHGEEKSIVARRPDVRFVRRFYPLDQTCNSKLTVQLHAGACDLAKGGICAEKQGRFDAYDDLAFATQKASPGPEKLAEQLGLDMNAFRDCMAAPETEQRLAADIAAGDKAGVTFTPAMQIEGKIYSKEMLPLVLGSSETPAGK
jgi:uncharacterized membrane protein